MDGLSVKEHAATVLWKGWEANNLQITVNFRTVIDDFQCFAVECGVFIDAKPFSIHIGENTAEGVVDERLQWTLFQHCQCRVTIAKNLVHCGTVFVEYHLDVCKSKGHMVKHGVVTMIIRPCSGHIIVRQCLRNDLPLDV